MAMTLDNPISILEALEPCETTLMVRVNPAGLSQETLQTLAAAAEPQDSARELRGWLRGCIANETNRRLLGEDFSDGPREAAAWVMPWHQWTDGELREALAASYSWFGMRLTREECEVFDAIHRAVVTICCTRLGELHSAIVAAQSRGK